MITKIKLNRNILIGALAIMFAAFLWSLDGTFIRPKFYTLPAGLVVFLEHFLGFIVLSPFIFISWKRIKALNRKSWLAVLWIAVFGGLIGTLFITKAFFAAIFGATTFATVIILQKLQPVFALIMARIILKEKLSKSFYWWAVIAVVAGYFLAFGKTGLKFSEIDWTHSAALFSFIAAFAFGSSTVLGKRIVNHLDFAAAAALRFGATSVLALTYILITGDLFKMAAINSTQWRLLPVIVFTSGAAAMFIYYFGLRRVTASVSSICELFWPLSAILLDYVFNKNVLSGIQIVAAIILLITFFQVIRQGQKIKQLSFSARIVAGEGKGKEFGFPTANLDRTDIDISHGIYLVQVKVGENSYQGLMHFGLKENFGDVVSTEVYIHNFSGDIYNQEILVEVVKKIREVRKFDTIEELKRQMGEDLKVLG